MCKCANGFIEHNSPMVQNFLEPWRREIALAAAVVIPSEEEANGALIRLVPTASDGERGLVHLIMPSQGLQKCH